jgi:PTS system nitrogen regulatory IIA component
MQLSKDIALDYALYGLKSNNKRECMRDIAQFICAHNRDLQSVDLFDKLLDQEKQTGSGIGQGIALPHLRLQALKQPLNIIAHLDKPISFDSADGKDVRIIWITLSPKSDGPRHLMRLAKVSRMLRAPMLATQLGEARSIDELRALLLGAEQTLSMAA